MSTTDILSSLPGQTSTGEKREPVKLPKPEDPFAFIPNSDDSENRPW